MSPEDKARPLQEMQTFQEELVKKWLSVWDI